MKESLLIMVVLWGTTAFAAPQRVPNALMDSLISRGIDLTLRQHYQEASETFRVLSRRFPEHPSGYLYQAAVLQTVAMDYELPIPGNDFDSLLALAERRIDEMVELEPGSPWWYYFRGTMLGYDSYARAQRGDWLGAATKGMSSASELEKAVALDSTMIDAYAGIGTYYYWKSRKIQFLTWLPFIGDHRAKGIGMLQQCVERGDYNRFAAISSLIAIYLDAENYARAESMARMALGRYPNNRIFLWGLATALEKAGRPDDSILAYESLLQAILGDPRKNQYNELVCRLNLAKLKESQGETGTLLADLDAILAMDQESFAPHLETRAREKIEEARLLRLSLTAGKSSGR